MFDDFDEDFGLEETFGLDPIDAMDELEREDREIAAGGRFGRDDGFDDDAFDDDAFGDGGYLPRRYAGFGAAPPAPPPAPTAPPPAVPAEEPMTFERYIHLKEDIREESNRDAGFRILIELASGVWIVLMTFELLEEEEPVSFLLGLLIIAISCFALYLCVKSKVAKVRTRREKERELEAKYRAAQKHTQQEERER